ncbi:uncharacterized protein LOC133554822 isoform X1 [Nerophis ophidion]|uniref:uncharacterized protein LOC133554822 isoform X1 n=1 Tax=Nerophis ophidion TaxID=159077 RepID=UPI002ADFA71D|nr:uncharacterized protein LOC133554822 isoform X1 [Nerophis ophidion]
MNRITLIFQVIAVYYAIPSHAEVRATCDQNVDVDCPCRDSSEFLALRWYKMSGETRYAVISTSDNGNEKSSFHRPAMFGERNSLHLPRVTPQDSGIYKCIILAGINRPNKECTVNLLVHATIGWKAGHTLDKSPPHRRANTDRQTTFTHSHTRANLVLPINLSPGACLWMWEEAGVPGGNPRIHGADMQTPHRKIPSPGLNLGLLRTFVL